MSVKCSVKCREKREKRRKKKREFTSNLSRGKKLPQLKISIKVHNNQEAARRATGQWVTGELHGRQCLGWWAWCAPCVNTVLGRWSCSWRCHCLVKMIVLQALHVACRSLRSWRAHLTYAQFFTNPPSACYFCCTSFFIDSNIGTIPTTAATTWPVIFVPFSLQFMHTRGQPEPPKRGRGGSNYIVQIHARPALFWSLPVNTPNGSY